MIDHDLERFAEMLSHEPINPDGWLCDAPDEGRRGTMPLLRRDTIPSPPPNGAPTGEVQRDCRSCGGDGYIRATAHRPEIECSDCDGIGKVLHELEADPRLSLILHAAIVRASALVCLRVRRLPVILPPSTARAA